MAFEIGQKFKNNLDQEFEIIGYESADRQGCKRYLIRFTKTGYERVVSRSSVAKHSVKDDMTITKYGVGYLGGYKLTSTYPTEYKVWNNMMSRCYNNVPSNKDYVSYGQIGVKVCERWHCFKHFIEDFPLIDGYNKELVEKGKLCFDKDKKQQHIPHNERIYSLETTTFITREENQKYRDSIKTRKKGIAISPDGKEYQINGIAIFAKEHGLEETCIGLCLRGVYKQHKGWTFKPL